MIEYSVDRDRRRVVITTVSGSSGGRTRLNIGELIYQIHTDAGWCDAVSIEDVQRGARATVASGSPSGTHVEIQDHFRPDEYGITIARTWRFTSPGTYRLLFDYRLLTSAEGVVLPSFRYAAASEHALRSTVATRWRRLSLPGAFFLGERQNQSVVVHCQAVEWESRSTFPEVASGFTVECATSGGQPAARVQFPETSFILNKRNIPATATATIRVASQPAGLGSMVRREYEVSWRAIHQSDRTAPDDDGRLWADLKSARLSFLSTRVAEWQGQPVSALPAQDERDRRPARLFTAVSPYGSLPLAHALAAAGHISDVPESMGLFFCDGLQSDGTLSDVYDPRGRHWGTVRPGTTEFLRGETDPLRSLESAIELVGIYSGLRRLQRDCQKLVRTAAEIAAFGLRHQRADGSVVFPDGSNQDATALLVVLLAALDRSRGRNSSRVGAMKRAAQSLAKLARDDDFYLATASSRDRALLLLRAGLDLIDRRIPAPIERLVETAEAALLSWVFNRDLSFPARSSAARSGLKTTGLAIVSVDRPHLDFDVLPIAYEMLRLRKFSGDAWPGEVAQKMIAASSQLVGGIQDPRTLLGSQPAEVGFSDWVSTRQRPVEPGNILGARTMQVSRALLAMCLIERDFPEEVYVTA